MISCHFEKAPYLDTPTMLVFFQHELVYPTSSLIHTNVAEDLTRGTLILGKKPLNYPNGFTRRSISLQLHSPRFTYLSAFHFFFVYHSQFTLLFPLPPAYHPRTLRLFGRTIIRLPLVATSSRTALDSFFPRCFAFSPATKDSAIVASVRATTRSQTRFQKTARSRSHGSFRAPIYHRQ